MESISKTRKVDWDDIDKSDRPNETELEEADSIIMELMPGDGKIIVLTSHNSQGYSNKSLKYTVRSTEGTNEIIRFIKLSRELTLGDTEKVNAEKLRLCLAIGQLRNKITKPERSTLIQGKLCGMIYDIPIEDPSNLKDYINKNLSDEKIVDNICKYFIESVFDIESKGILGIIYGKGKHNDENTYADYYTFDNEQLKNYFFQSIKQICFDKSELQLFTRDPIEEITALLVKRPRIGISLIHGDLNLGNIIKEGYLIDFDSVRQGHTAFDFAKLETEIKRHFVGKRLGHIEDLIEFERRLYTSEEVCIEWDKLTQICFQLIRKIREYAFKQKAFNDRPLITREEYFHSLIFTGLASLKYNQPHILHRHRAAYTSASVALTHLYSLEREVPIIKPFKAILLVDEKRELSEFSIGKFSDNLKYFQWVDGDNSEIVKWKLTNQKTSIEKNAFKAKEIGVESTTCLFVGQEQFSSNFDIYIRKQFKPQFRVILKDIIIVEKMGNDRISVSFRNPNPNPNLENNIELRKILNEIRMILDKILDLTRRRSIHNFQNTTLSSIQIPFCSEQISVEIKLKAEALNHFGKKVKLKQFDCDLDKSLNNIKLGGKKPDDISFTININHESSAKLKLEAKNCESIEIEINVEKPVKKLMICPSVDVFPANKQEDRRYYLLAVIVDEKSLYDRERSDLKWEFSYMENISCKRYKPPSGIDKKMEPVTGKSVPFNSIIAGFWKVVVETSNEPKFCSSTYIEVGLNENYKIKLEIDPQKNKILEKEGQLELELVSKETNLSIYMEDEYRNCKSISDEININFAERSPKQNKMGFNRIFTLLFKK